MARGAFKKLKAIAMLALFGILCGVNITKRMLAVTDENNDISMDRNDADRRQGSGMSRRTQKDPEVKVMFEEFGVEDDRKGDRRTSADRRDENSVKSLVEESGDSPGYME